MPMSSFFPPPYRVENNLMLKTVTMTAIGRHPAHTICQAKFRQPYSSSSWSFNPHNLSRVLLLNPFYRTGTWGWDFFMCSSCTAGKWQPEFQAKRLALESLHLISVLSCLDQWFSKHGPQISSSSCTAWELRKNTHYWPTPHPLSKKHWGWFPGLLFNKP